MFYNEILPCFIMNIYDFRGYVVDNMHSVLFSSKSISSFTLISNYLDCLLRNFMISSECYFNVYFFQIADVFPIMKD